MATFLHRLGRASFRHRFTVFGLWLLILAATAAGAVTLSGKTINTFEIPGQESTEALALVDERFGAAAAGATARVVLQAPGTSRIEEPEVTPLVAAAVKELGTLPGVAQATDPLDPAFPTVSEDGRAVFSTVTYTGKAADVTAEQRAALLAAVDRARAAGLTAEVSGNATTPPAAESEGIAEGVSTLLALLVLAITYGSLVAAGMNLLTAIIGVGIGMLGITTLTGFMDLQSTTPILAIMLGLAVGIDYALFIFTRYRQELLAGRPPEEAAAVATGTAGSAVVTAGLTVVIALCGLTVAGIPFLTEMGLAAAGAIVVSVLIGITLVPAGLGILRLRVLPKKLRKAVTENPTGDHGKAKGGFYSGWATMVVRGRWPSLILSLAALAVIAVPYFSMQTSLSQRPAEGTTQAKATELLAERFGPGFNGPLLILIDGPGAAESGATISKEAGTLPGVVFASPPVPNPDASAALIQVIPASSPEDQKTVDLVHLLRKTFGAGTGPEVYVTGTTAVSVDVSERLDQALPTYLILVVGLALLLLLLVFRSVLVPLVGVLGFLASIGAALGSTVAVYQWGWLKDVFQVEAVQPIMSLSPIIVVGILFGLAMDYQVFLVSRMHEAHSHGASPRDAVITGFRQAAPVVVAAAIIMFVVFASFIPEGEAMMKPIAFALATGIIFDAIVVRMITVPAALSILGRAAWWLPRWLSWLPGLDVEGRALTSTEKPTDKDTEEEKADSAASSTSRS